MQRRTYVSVMPLWKWVLMLFHTAHKECKELRAQKSDPPVSCYYARVCDALRYPQRATICGADEPWCDSPVDSGVLKYGSR